MSDMGSEDGSQFVIAESDAERDEGASKEMMPAVSENVSDRDDCVVEKSTQDNVQVLSSEPMEQTLSKSQRKRLKKKKKNKENAVTEIAADAEPTTHEIEATEREINDVNGGDDGKFDQNVKNLGEDDLVVDNEIFGEVLIEEHNENKDEVEEHNENTHDVEEHNENVHEELEEENQTLPEQSDVNEEERFLETVKETQENTEETKEETEPLNEGDEETAIAPVNGEELGESISVHEIPEPFTPVKQMRSLNITHEDDHNPFAISEQSDNHLDELGNTPLRAATSEDEANGTMDDVPIEEVSPLDKSDDAIETEEPVVVYRYAEVTSKKDRMKELTKNFVFGLAVVDFDHHRGPELQYWLDDDIINGSATVEEKVAHFSKVWPYFAFQALPDGVHKFDETFTQFTLCYDELLKSGVDLGIEKMRIVSDNDVNEDEDAVLLEDPNQGVVTLFGCACIRQLDSNLLKEEKKRSIVQKSVVLITRAPMPVQMKEKLSIVTKSWFEQCEFEDVEILKLLYENLTNIYNKHGFSIEDDDLYEESVKKRDSEKKIIRESDFFLGLNFQDVVLKMRRNLLVILKCLMLAEYKILIFSKDLNELSNTQYTLVGLISNLIINLEDSGYPPLDKHLHEVKRKVQSLRSSDRLSMLKFLGLPLHVFGQGSFFQPYLTLQQISYLTNVNTKSFLVGSSNDILLDHKKEWFDVVVYLDEKEGGLFSSFYGGCKVEILNTSLKDVISLSSDDKKFIDGIISAVDKLQRVVEEEPGSSKTINSNTSIENDSFVGGNDFIRTKIEDYIIGFLSSVKYDNFVNYKGDTHEGLWIYKNDIGKFGKKFVSAFKGSRVYSEWNAISEDELFSFFPPGHVNSEELNLRENKGNTEENKGKANESVEKLKSFFTWKRK